MPLDHPPPPPPPGFRPLRPRAHLHPSALRSARGPGRLPGLACRGPRGPRGQRAAGESLPAGRPWRGNAPLADSRAPPSWLLRARLRPCPTDLDTLDVKLPHAAFFGYAGFDMKSILLVVAAVSAGLVVVQCGGSPEEPPPSPAPPPPADVLVENQRLRGENQRFSLENERLRGELGRAQTDLAEEQATRDQLEERLAEEEQARRLAEDQVRRLAEDQVRDADQEWQLAGALGVVVVVLATLALWRELWWRLRSEVLLTGTARPVRVVGEDSTAVARRVTNTTVEVDRT